MFVSVLCLVAIQKRPYSFCPCERCFSVIRLNDAPKGLKMADECLSSVCYRKDTR